MSNTLLKYHSNKPDECDYIKRCFKKNLWALITTKLSIDVEQNSKSLDFVLVTY